MHKAGGILVSLWAMFTLVVLLAVCALTAHGGQSRAVQGAPSASPQPIGQSVQKEVVKLAEFDNDVAACRRAMRKYCAIVQQLVAKPGDEEQSKQAPGYLWDARSQWEAIHTKYAKTPPAEYAADARFAARLSEIVAAMEEMEGHLTAGRFKQSFAACGRGCSIFVQMHEENGLVYALDRLFHLRKLAKTAVAAAKIKGPLTAGQYLPDMLYHLNRVVLAPCPWPDDNQRCKDFRASLTDLFSTLNDLASSIGNQNLPKTEAILNGLIGVINKAYSNAL